MYKFIKMKSSSNNIDTQQKTNVEDSKWSENIFVNEMEERFSSYMNKEAETFSWAQVQAEANAALLKLKQDK